MTKEEALVLYHAWEVAMAFEAAIRPTQEAYEAAVRQIQKTYEAAMGQARQDYEVAMQQAKEAFFKRNVADGGSCPGCGAKVETQ